MLVSPVCFFCFSRFLQSNSLTKLLLLPPSCVEVMTAPRIVYRHMKKKKKTKITKPAKDRYRHRTISQDRLPIHKILIEKIYICASYLHSSNFIHYPLSSACESCLEFKRGIRGHFQSFRITKGSPVNVDPSVWSVKLFHRAKHNGVL